MNAEEIAKEIEEIAKEIADKVAEKARKRNMSYPDTEAIYNCVRYQVEKIKISDE